MKEKTCGHCAMMRKEDGYCRKKSNYVNALTEGLDCWTDPAGLEDLPKITKKGKKAQPEEPAPVPQTLAPGERPPRKGGNRRYVTPPGTKYCPMCNRILPLDAFGADKRKWDGHSSRCKECNAAYAREAWAKKKTAIAEMKMKLKESSERQAKAVKQTPTAPKETPVTELPAAPAPLSTYTEETLVAELRSRGWTVVATKSL